MRRPVAWVGAALPLLAGLASCTADTGEGASPSPTPVVAPADYARLEKTPVRESMAELGLPASTPPEAEPVAAHDFVVTVREVAVMDVLSPEQRDAISLRIEPQALRRAVGEGPFPAGPGREFLVAWVVEPEEAPLRDAQPVPVSVRAEDQPQPVHLGNLRPGLGAVVVVNVPAGGDAILGLRGEAELSVSLRTGRVVTDAGSPANRLAGDNIVVRDYFQVTGVSDPDLLEPAFCAVTVEPAAPGGTVEPGHMWLEVSAEVSLNAQDDGDAAAVTTVAVDLGESLSIVGADGTEFLVPARTIQLTGRSSGEVDGGWSERYEVPDTLREIEVSFRLEATFRADGTTHSYQRFDRGDNTGTLTLTPID